MIKLRYQIETAGLFMLTGIFRILPLDAASAAGGWLGRFIGPRLAASRKARRNLENAMPDLDVHGQNKIIAGMWENLGRVIAEYPHLQKIGKERVTFDVDPISQKLFDDNTPCMMVGAHMANWEVGAAGLLLTLGKPVDLTYRAPNNPGADRLLMKARTLNGRLRAYPKSRGGGQEIIRAMRDGRTIGMLVDQKYNEGVPVPFFGRAAMTNPAFVQLARKYGYPLVPWRIERTKGAHFKITVCPPLLTEERSTENIIAQAHTLLEDWIRQRPEQWLWLHRRWDSRKLSETKEAA